MRVNVERDRSAVCFDFFCIPWRNPKKDQCVLFSLSLIHYFNKDDRLFEFLDGQVFKKSFMRL